MRSVSVDSVAGLRMVATQTTRPVCPVNTIGRALGARSVSAESQTRSGALASLSIHPPNERVEIRFHGVHFEVIARQLAPSLADHPQQLREADR